MTWSTRWPAPAKLNRFLHIVGRRADGYHLLQTVFQFIDRCDELAFRVRDDGEVHRRGWAELPEETDLTVRAARLLAAEADVPWGVDLHLIKRIPMGGGLGGGSSDAATTLVALNRLWGIDWAQPRLRDLAVHLGADVPVFVAGRAAWADGIGDVFHSVPLDEPWFVVVDPGVSIATGEVFAAPQLTRDTPRSKIRRLDAGEFRNDCETVVRARYPVVGEALDWLARWSEARLTGTGGCIFAAFPDSGNARRVAAEAPAPWRAFVARGLNRSPLPQRLALSDAAGSARQS